MLNFHEVKSSFCLNRRNQLFRLLMALPFAAIISAMGCLLVCASFVQARAGSPDLADLDIERQPLSSALEAYSRATGVQILYESGAAQNVESPGVKGTLSNDEALRRILQGSQLDAIYLKRNAVALRAPRKPELPPQLFNSDLSLEPLRIRLTPDRFSLAGFEDNLKRDVQRALKRERASNSRNYTVGVRLWLLDREVGRADIFRSSGDRGLDGSISHILAGLPLSQSAPSSISQPVSLLVVVRNL